MPRRIAVKNESREIGTRTQNGARILLPRDATDFYLHHRAPLIRSHCREGKLPRHAAVGLNSLLPAVVQAGAQFLAGAEDGGALFVDLDGRTGSRVSARAPRSHLHGESAEAADLDALPVRQRSRDFVENCGNDPLHVAMVT